LCRGSLKGHLQHRSEITDRSSRVIVEIDQLMARDTVPPPFGDDRTYQLKRGLTVMIAPHPRLNRAVDQTEKASIRLVQAETALSFLAVPPGNLVDPDQGATKDDDIIFVG
jgi:hypothetical protein